MSNKDRAATLLGDDLWDLIGGVGGRLVEAVPLTTLPSSLSRRAAFRLRFSDGRLLKGCRFDSADEARRVAVLLPLLDRRYFPGLLATRGAGALLEWAEGEPLKAEQCDRRLVEEMGSLHAALHEVALPPPRRGREEWRVPDWPGRLAGCLDELVSLDAIDRATGDRAHSLARAATPGDFPGRLVHNDFCRENMVVAPGGGIRVVDNETLAVDCPDHDLARTWYRWPMDSRQAEAYLGAYGRTRSTEAIARHFPFWAVTVLAHSALFRLRRGISSAAHPLSRLRGMLARYDDSGHPPAFVEEPGPGRPDGAAR
jgi:aminoglycoside phosphotransferase (APT) family kinase protein